MSFILEALRKSEHDRQRQAGPGLAEVSVASTRSRSNRWATAAVALLVVNLVAIGILLVRRADRATTPEPAANAAAATSAPPSAAASRSAADAASAPPAAIAAPASVTATVPDADDRVANSRVVTPPMLQPAGPPIGTATPATRNPLELEVTDASPYADPVLAERAASVPGGPPAVVPVTRPGQVIYESLPEAGPTLDAPPSGLPTIDDVALQGGVPDMHVDLHVYSENPQERFVFVNKRKYREGETLAEGPVVEKITRDGVVLNRHGTRFLLPRQ